MPRVKDSRHIIAIDLQTGRKILSLVFLVPNCKEIPSFSSLAVVILLVIKDVLGVVKLIVA